MAKQAGFCSVDDHLAVISTSGTLLEALNVTVDFRHFRPFPERAAERLRSPKGGRLAFDVALRFRMLVLQNLHRLSFKVIERMVRDSLSWIRLCSLGTIGPVPDADTLGDFRVALIKTAASTR